MGRLTLRVLAIVLAALAVTACGEERTRETDASRTPGPSDTIVVYERVGGEEGARERLDVRPDGAIRVSDRERSATATLTSAELDELRAARDAIDFAVLESGYGSGQVVLDGYKTRISAGDRTITITHEAKLPPELERLRATCASMFEKYRPR